MKMVTLDYIILAIVLISAIAGLVQGFLRESINLVTWVIAVWLAWKLGPVLGPHLGGTLREPPYGLWAGRAIVFIAVLVVGAIVAAIVNHYVRLSIFSGLDRFLGFVLGIGRGTVIVGVCIVLGEAVHLDGEGWWKGSCLMPLVQPVSAVLRTIAGDHLKTATDGN